ncbi:MAG: nuclear transport factor 2 family protein [Roseivirga sp.]|nr:nuclear transport factor 2 family protein [Roseivirga sp.]
MKKHLILALFLIFTFSCAGPERKKQKELGQLEASIDLFNTAFEQGDLSTLDSLTTDNYIHTNGSDRAFSKERWFNYLESRRKNLVSGQLKIDKYQLLEKEIQLYEKSAIVTGLIITSGFSKGAEFSNQIRVSNLWIKEKETWKRAAFHDTRIQ